jgi:hypothetical protein
MIRVFHLLSDIEYHYDETIGNITALINTAIAEDNRTAEILDWNVRREYQEKIHYGKFSAAIGDWAVKLD